VAQRLVWYGQLTTRPRLMRLGLLLALPGLLWIALLLLLPLVALAVLAFLKRGHPHLVEWELTLANFWRVAGYSTLFGWTGDNLRILGRSVVVGGATTMACLLLAYPLAFWIASRPPRRRYLWLALVVVPLCTNVVIRAYAWMLLLAPSMPPARLAQWAGLIDPHAALYPSLLAVYLGMVTTFLPFSVLPIYTNVERLDWSIVEACRDLYAGRLRVFWHAILPQTLPGLAVAVVLTFVPAMGMFVVPDLLGGAKHDLVGNLIQRQFGSARNWPLGAALSLTLMAMTLVIVLLAWRAGQANRTHD
jgi:spermidine/putrescine transport system permease protein